MGVAEVLSQCASGRSLSRAQRAEKAVFGTLLRNCRARVPGPATLGLYKAGSQVVQRMHDCARCRVACLPYRISSYGPSAPASASRSRVLKNACLGLAPRRPLGSGQAPKGIQGVKQIWGRIAKLMLGTFSLEIFFPPPANQ